MFRRRGAAGRAFVAELCVLRTFGGVDFSLIFICAQSVSEFLWDRLRASIQFPVMPKRAQYARFSGEHAHAHAGFNISSTLRGISYRDF
eukprot:COSAG02_NODE_2503_length_8671_cov_20.133108_11_plen_89_part_00